jgi:hypothetical protein
VTTADGPPDGDADPDLEAHFHFLVTRLAAGKVIPFLGAGANLCGRPPDADWQRDSYLPSAAELATYLAADYPYLSPRDAHDLSRVSQYVDLFGGDAVLFEKLRALFAGDYGPNALHAVLAAIPAANRRRDSPSPCPLIITTNYDDALESAFAAAGETVDVIYYAAGAEQAGRFVHLRPDGRRTAIPKSYRGFDLGQRTVIMKIHGAVDRQDEGGDSYVITEDHYIDYVARTNIYNLIPAAVMARMSTSHFLFLGYGLRDWNLRVILHHIWSRQARSYRSWAIQNRPDPIDEKFWERDGVEIIEMTLEQWVVGMRAHL